MRNVQALLAQLEAAELVRWQDTTNEVLSFKHALVQDTAYATLLKGDRKLIHRAVAASLVSNFPDRLDENAAALAEHSWRAEDWTNAAEYSLRAGKNALRVFAMREAMNHFERARTAFENAPAAAPEAKIDAILGWAQAAIRFRPYPEQLAALSNAEELARAVDDKPRLAQVLYRMGSAQMASGHNLRAAPIFAECFTLAGELGDEQLTVLPTYFMGTVVMDADPHAALDLLEQAVTLAQKYHNPDVLASALGTQAMLYARLGETETAQIKLREALDALGQVQSPMTESDVMLYAAWAWLEMGDTGRGLEWGQKGVDKALASENMDCLCYGFACVGFGNLYSNNTIAAREAFQEAVRRSHYSGAQQVENLATLGWAMSKIYSGDPEALPELERAFANATELGNPFVAALAAQTLSEIFAAQNDTPRAHEYRAYARAYFERAGLAPYLERLDAAQKLTSQAQHA